MQCYTFVVASDQALRGFGRGGGGGGVEGGGMEDGRVNPPQPLLGHFALGQFLFISSRRGVFSQAKLKKQDTIHAEN